MTTATATPTRPASAFEEFEADAYPYRFAGKLHIPCLAGGVPSDPKKVEGWIRSKLNDKDDILRDLVNETVIERGIDSDAAAEVIARNQHLNGFKRDPSLGLYIEGRQLKAAIKEAGSVAVAAGKLDGRGWGKTNKGIRSLLAEHVFVLEDRLYLGVDEPTGVNQRFVHTFRGNGIQYEEYVENAEIEFTVATDQDLSDKEWAMLWLTGSQNGIGAARSQGYGVYTVTSWEAIS